MVTAALINDTLSAIGAIGGLLSIVGVGLLILLVASQSRQIRAMREWIEQEPQRQQETAQRVIAEVQRRIAAARERRAGSSTPPPAGGIPIPKAPPAPGTLGATPEAQATAAKQELVPPPLLPAAGGEAPKFAPLTPAGGSDASVPPPAIDDDEPAVVTEMLGQETQAADALPDADDDFDAIPAAVTGRGRDARFGDEQFDLEEDERPRSNRLLFGVGALALLAGIVLIATQLFGGDDPKSSQATTDNGSETAPKPTGGGASNSQPAEIDPKTVTVRVFNGTQISGLAQRTTDRLKAAEYSVTDPQTLSTSQTSTTTQVFFRPNNKSAATMVAKELGLDSSAVEPITTEVSVAAGETAEVVVITGSDLDTGDAAGSTTE